MSKITNAQCLATITKHILNLVTGVGGFGCCIDPEHAIELEYPGLLATVNRVVLNALEDYEPVDALKAVEEK